MAIINGTAGDDDLFGTTGDDQINGFAGNDRLFGESGNDILDGGDDHDALRGDEGNDVLLGGNGDDFLRGDDFGVGDDILDGGAGWDRATYAVGASAGVTVDLNIQGVAQNTGSKGFDTLIGIEHLSGTIFDDVLTGNGGDNWLWGGSDTSGVTGNDVITAGGGNDLVEVGAGNHNLDGGTGIDSLSLWGNDTDITAAGVTVSLLLQGAAQDTEQGMMILNRFENLSGSRHADNLTGDGDDNVIAGDQGNDVLAGGAGSDTLYGDGRIIVDTHDTGGSGPITTYADVTVLDPVNILSGNDTLEGGLGDDVLNGGGGSDTASYANAAGEVFVSLGAVNGFASGADGDDTLTGIENVTGSAHDDQIFGNNDANVISGGAGHDYLRGRGGNDSLYGNDGDDYLGGGFGDDLLDGGAGWDRVAFFHDAVAGVTVDLNIQGSAQNTGQGMDILVGIEHASGTVFDDVLVGNAGDNWLWGEGGNDSFSAGDGNDLVEAGAGNVTADGGAGNDGFSVWGNGLVADPGGVTISLALQGAAQATGIGSMILTGFENLSGSAFDDALTGDGGANILAGDEGDDTLSGGSGNDTLLGDGRIIIDSHDTGTSGPIVTYADLVAAFPGDPELASGDDTLEGGDGDDVLNGGGGTDTASYASASGAVEVFLNAAGNGFASGAAGNDSLTSIEAVQGSAFDDQLITAAAASRLSGGAGNDFITGQNGTDTLEGEDGHDQLRGNNGNDILRGGDGDDFLAGGNGDDLLDGGAGWDRTSFFTGATAGVAVDLNIQGVAQNTGRGMDTLVGIEHTSGTAFDDVLTGNGGDNWLWGDPTGNDTLSGNGGNDLLWVGVGNHVVSGGAGTDTLGVNASDVPSGVTWSLALQGAPQATGHDTIDLSGVENLSGSEHADSLTGDGGANVLAGALGNDTLSGGDGNDTLYGDGAITIDIHGNGGSGPIVTYTDIQTVQGGVSGNDVIDGGKGSDVIVGGGGDDVMTGGAGDDLFIVGLGSGDDRVADMGKKDAIAIVGVAGVDHFSDLSIVNDASGKNAVVSWGTGDSVTLEGVKASKVSASMFVFEDPTVPAASMVAASAAVSGGDMIYVGDPGFGS